MGEGCDAPKATGPNSPSDDVCPLGRSIIHAGVVHLSQRLCGASSTKANRLSCVLLQKNQHIPGLPAGVTLVQPTGDANNTLAGRDRSHVSTGTPHKSAHGGCVSSTIRWSCWCQRRPLWPSLANAAAASLFFAFLPLCLVQNEQES